MRKHRGTLSRHFLGVMYNSDRKPFIANTPAPKRAGGARLNPGPEIPPAHAQPRRRKARNTQKGHAPKDIRSTVQSRPCIILQMHGARQRKRDTAYGQCAAQAPVVRVSTRARQRKRAFNSFVKNIPL